MNFNTNNSIKLRPKIYLLPDNAQPDFEKTVLRSLRDLEKISVGRRLIEKIGKCSHRVYIASTEDDWTCAVVNQKKASIPGKGSISVILFPKTKTMTDRHYLTAKLKTAAKPSFVDFAHELIHAYYNACGKNALYLNRCDKLVWTDDEEYKTIMGFPSKNPLRKTPKITENHRKCHFSRSWLTRKVQSLWILRWLVFGSHRINF